MIKVKWLSRVICSSWLWTLLTGHAAAQTVSAVNSTMYGPALQGGSTWLAGQPVQFFVQLRDSQSNNVSNVFNVPLRITCVPDPNAPANSSFCTDPPLVVPVAPGCFSVTLTVGVIWGEYQNHQISSWSGANLTAAAQGQNYLHVMYNGTHVSGSPIKPILQPELLVSRYLSYIQFANPAQAIQASSPVRPTPAYIIQVADRFTNWIRHWTLETNITFLVTTNDSYGGTIVWPTTVAFRGDWTRLQFRMTNGTVAGAYNFQVLYNNPNGFKDVLPIRTTNADVEKSTFYIRPSTLNSWEVTSSGVPAAAEDHYIYHVRAKDRFGNVAVLSSSYAFDKVPWYTPNEQDASLLQVDSYPTGCLANCAKPIVTIDFDQSNLGALLVSVTTTIPGNYTTDFRSTLTGKIFATQQHQVTASPYPVAAHSYAALEADTVVAGSGPVFLLHLADKYNNTLTAPPKSQVIMQITTPDFKTIQHQVQGSHNRSVAAANTVAGQYEAVLQLGNATGNTLSYKVIPNPQSNAYFCQASGLGLGVQQAPTSPTYRRNPYIIAGIHYDIRVAGYDAWNNPQNGIATYFTFDAAFAAACTNLTYEADQISGATLIHYAINKAGTYNMTILTPDQGVVHAHELDVISNPKVTKIVSVGLPNASSPLTAGATLDFGFQPVDPYGNVPTSSPGYIEVTGGILESITTYAVSTVDSAGVQRVHLKLTQTGTVVIAAVVPQLNYSQVLRVLEVAPDTLKPANTYIKGPQTVTAEAPLVLLLLPRDTYGNPIPATHDMTGIVGITSMPSCNCVLKVYVRDSKLYISTTIKTAGVYNLYVMLNQSPTASWPYQELVLPLATNTTAVPGCTGSSPCEQQGAGNASGIACTGHGASVGDFCICDDGWITNTSLWVSGIASWCNEAVIAQAASYEQSAVPKALLATTVILGASLLCVATAVGWRMKNTCSGAVLQFRRLV